MKVENGKAHKGKGKGEEALFNESTVAFLVIANKKNRAPSPELPSHQGNYFLPVVLQVWGPALLPG